MRVLRRHNPHAVRKTVKRFTIADIRDYAERSAAVRGGVLYQSGNVVQAWWDADETRPAARKETWFCPDRVQATREFDDMVARWQ